MFNINLISQQKLKSIHEMCVQNLTDGNHILKISKKLTKGKTIM